MVHACTVSSLRFLPPPLTSRRLARLCCDSAVQKVLSFSNEASALWL